MSADGLSVVTLLFPDPKTTAPADSNISVLDPSLSFRLSLGTEIKTLSTTNLDVNSNIVGLLYLPELDPGDSCQDQLFNYVPSNATSQLHLPVDAQYTFLALAPWISVTCTQQFLYAARDDPLRAFVFFLPDNKTTVPADDDPAWSLNDGGKWKKNNKFPVFAISGQHGAEIMHNMALYSGNLTSVPNGHTLANQYPPSAYVRLAGSINMDSHSPVPSLWALLLIVLGIVVAIIAITSGTMHVIHRRRRASLRRRVASGEVDLERLGIKNLTIPRSILQSMPLYTYDTASKEPVVSEKSASASRTPSLPDSLANQPTCAICSDDFVPDESLVRQLPCQHIFHSECVDTFLRENSSLCPLCKKSSLPLGYCPPVLTHTMVRRERALRRMREQVLDGGEHEPTTLDKLRPSNWRSWLRWRRSDAEQPVDEAAAEASEALHTHQSTGSHLLSDEVQYQTRPEWARQRALEMVNAGEADSVHTHSGEQNRSSWRRYFSKVWPGLV